MTNGLSLLLPWLACSYKHLHGKFVVHPVSQRRIPIIADAELVDMEFGTGAAHTQQQQRHSSRHGGSSIYKHACMLSAALGGLSPSPDDAVSCAQYALCQFLSVSAARCSGTCDNSGVSWL